MEEEWTTRPNGQHFRVYQQRHTTMSGARIKQEFVRQAVAKVEATAPPELTPDAAAPKVHTGGYVLHKKGRGEGSKTNGGWKQRSKQKKVSDQEASANGSM